MVNPDFSGNFEGFKIEIMDGDSSVILEKIDHPAFSDVINILPGLLVATYETEFPFKWGNLEYGFAINLINKVDSNGRLYVNFTNSWIIENDDC